MQSYLGNVPAVPAGGEQGVAGAVGDQQVLHVDAAADHFDRRIVAHGGVHLSSNRPGSVSP